MEIHIGNRVAEVELISKENGIVRMLVDGEEHTIDVSRMRNGIYSVIENGKAYNAELARENNGRSYRVNSGFSSYDVQIVDARAKFLSLRGAANEHQDDKITSPMAGKVVKIPVEVGDKLEAGDTVIVIEAMKMQNSYKVASDCTIKEILVKVGDAIDSNQALISLDLLKKE
ncbi:MAG: biotin/lipoyl-containing protein [Bacteroidales bacterium]